MRQVNEMSTRRFSVAGSGGSRGGNRFAVLDSFVRDAQGGKRRISWHRTYRAAQTEAQRLNRLERQDA